LNLAGVLRDRLSKRGSAIDRKFTYTSGYVNQVVIMDESHITVRCSL